jgi:hypothetical protein
MMMFFKHGFEACRCTGVRKHLHEAKFAQNIERAVDRPKTDARKLFPNAF